MNFYCIQHERTGESWNTHITSYKNNYVSMQYEYGIQESNKVSEQWNLLKKIKNGDILFLRSSGRIHAWGYAVKPRLKNKKEESVSPIILNAQNIISKNNHDGYRSDNSKAYIIFEDCEVFYENLEDGEWGQRIDVECWRDWSPDGVPYKAEKGGQAIIKPAKEQALGYVRQLSGNPNLEFKEQQMQNYLKQLEQSKNIVLTGAPGTGKTYLAKKMAQTLSGSYNQILLARIQNFDEETKIKTAKDLLTEFQKKFPKNSLKNMSLEQYCIGTGDNSSFSYWLEKRLSPLGRFRPGLSSRGHFIYWDKEAEAYVVDESRAKGRTAEELMPQIAQTIQQLVDTKSPENLPIPNLYQNQILKILHSYYPKEYFPTFGRKQLEDICGNLGLKISKNLIETNRSVVNYFQNHKEFKNIDLIDIMYAIYSGDLKDSSNSSDVSNAELFQPIRFVQFHPSYDYTDFVEGLRPVKEEGSANIGFTLKSGIFKKLCADAAANPEIKFTLIIDEINRGEISKIFGELFFAIDPGYRGESGKVELQYANLYTDEETAFSEGFYVPKNVYIIGTMNNIDRSVEPFDFAMRRRFQWIEIEPKDRLSMLDDTLEASVKGKAINAMTLLNKAIVSPEVGLSSDYRIGPAYFLHLAKDKLDGNFDELWQYHIQPLLKEYLKGDPEETSKLEQLKKAYDETSNANTQG